MQVILLVCTLLQPFCLHAGVGLHESIGFARASWIYFSGGMAEVVDPPFGEVLKKKEKKSQDLDEERSSTDDLDSRKFSQSLAYCCGSVKLLLLKANAYNI